MVEKIKLRWFMLAGLVGFTAIVVVVYRYTAVFTTNVMADREAWGQFGDYFGGVLNPLLSFAAFITLLITLRVQLVAEAKNEADGRAQVREQRMFQLLEMVSQSTKNGSYFTIEEINVFGHQAFHHAWNEFRKRQLRQVKTHDTTPADMYADAQKVYMIFRRTEWPAISVFVESSFLLIDFITKNSSINDGFVQFAIGATRAQMTDAERCLLWYATLFEPGYAHMSRILQASGFVDTNPETRTDPLALYAEDLIQCAMIASNFKY